jgi:hypothetical protein
MLRMANKSWFRSKFCIPLENFYPDIFLRWLRNATVTTRSNNAPTRIRRKYFRTETCIIAVIIGSLSPRHGASSGCGWWNGLQYGGQLRICWISSSGQPTRGGPPAWRWGEVLTTPHRKNWLCYETRTLVSGVDCYFGAIQAKKKGHEIWHVEC